MIFGEFLGSSLILSEFKIPAIHSLPLNIGLPKKEVVSQPPFCGGYVTKGNSFTCFFDKSLWTIMMEKQPRETYLHYKISGREPRGVNLLGKFRRERTSFPKFPQRNFLGKFLRKRSSWPVEIFNELLREACKKSLGELPNFWGSTERSAEQCVLDGSWRIWLPRNVGSLFAKN